MITYGKDLHWEKLNKYEYKLYLKEVFTGVSVEPAGMYRIKWIDFNKDKPEYSSDYYNLTRAKDNAMKYVQEQENIQPSTP